MLDENVWPSSNIFIQHFVWRTMFDRLAASSNTMLDENVWSFSRGFTWCLVWELEPLHYELIPVRLKWPMRLRRTATSWYKDLVVPQILRDRVKKIAHEGHQGIVSNTKNRLRSRVWCPKMDNDVKKLCIVSRGCQVVSGYGPPEPMSRGPEWTVAGLQRGLHGTTALWREYLVVGSYLSRFYEVADDCWRH